MNTRIRIFGLEECDGEATGVEPAGARRARAVAERPMHPYEISTTLRTRGKESSIKLNFGSLYSVVESLAKHGLIEAQGTVRDGQASRAHHLRDHRRRPRRARGLAGRAARRRRRRSTPPSRPPSRWPPASRPTRSPGSSTPAPTRLRMDLGSIDAGLAYTDEMGLPELFVDRGAVPQGVMEAELAFVTRSPPGSRTTSSAAPPGGARSTSCRSRAISFEEISPDPVKHLGEEAAQLAPFLRS